MFKSIMRSAIAVFVLSSCYLLWAQQQTGVVKAIRSKDATGNFVERLGVGTVTNSEPTVESPDSSVTQAPCSSVTSNGAAPKNYIAFFTTPCNIEGSLIFEKTIKVGKVTTTTVNLSDALYVNGGKLGFLPTTIGGCSASKPLGSIAFGATNNTCTGFAIGSDGTDTYLAAPSGGHVHVNGQLYGTGGGDFEGSGGFVDGLSVSLSSGANSGFDVDNTGSASVGGSLFVGGDLQVNGQKNFQIDDPMDPANRYLYHSAVESSEMMNIYTGNVTTDAHGDATVQVPAWFESLNGDFRYQLTVIGQFAQAIVAGEIRDSKFTVKTDKPNVRVSWLVAGVRQDAYAKAHPLVVEQDKQADERGYYLHPELFGQPATKSIKQARQHPAPVKETQSAHADQVN